MKFEGFAKKEASTGAPIFHSKHEPKALPKATLPPGHPTFGKNAKAIARKPIPPSLD